MFAYLHGQKSYYIVVRIQWRKEHKIPVMYDICVPVIVAHIVHIHTYILYSRIWRYSKCVLASIFANLFEIVKFTNHRLVINSHYTAHIHTHKYVCIHMYVILANRLILQQYTLLHSPHTDGYYNMW